MDTYAVRSGAQYRKDPHLWDANLSLHTEITKAPGNFTGVVLPVFYVKDTLASLRFYRDFCGFTLKDFYDRESGKAVKEWLKAEPPIYISMLAASQEFALHLNRGEFPSIGGNLHYFEVKDVDEQHRSIIEQGGTPTEMANLPWMRLFSVTDLDGHRIFFQRPNPKWLEEHNAWR